MIINRAAKYLFVEPPFTGSTAIAGELMEQYGGERIHWKHAKYTEFRAQVGREADSFFVFATNRNPLDQAVSEFLKLKNNHLNNFTTPEKFRRNGGYITDETLAEFDWVQDTEADFAAYFRRYKTGLFNNWYLIGHESFDYVLDFADLAGEFETVLRRIGIDPVRPLPQVNATAGKSDFGAYYPSDTWAQAFRCYGPYMRKWEFEFPQSWGAPRVPVGARLRFHVVNRGVGLVTRHVNLSSQSGFVQRVKRFVQSTRK